MKLKLVRKFLGEDYTIGTLLINYETYCDTLEPTVREIDENGKGKIYGKTAIPKGTYNISLRFSPSFNRMMPYLDNVPHFQNIMIHTGNTVDDTQGCILVGQNKTKSKLSDSIKTFMPILHKITNAIENNNEKVTIEII